MDDIPLEASPEDVIEQRSEVLAPDGADFGVPAPPAPPSRSLSWEADPADVAEQLAEVPLDDDDRT